MSLPLVSDSFGSGTFSTSIAGRTAKRSRSHEASTRSSCDWMQLDDCFACRPTPKMVGVWCCNNSQGHHRTVEICWKGTPQDSWVTLTVVELSEEHGHPTSTAILSNMLRTQVAILQPAYPRHRSQTSELPARSWEESLLLLSLVI